MSQEPNNMDRIVREKLDGFEMTPPPSVWNNMEAKLSVGRKRRFIWLFFAIAILTFSTLGAYYYNSGKSDATQIGENHNTSTKTESTSKNKTNNQVQAEDEDEDRNNNSSNGDEDDLGDSSNKNRSVNSGSSKTISSLGLDIHGGGLKAEHNQTDNGDSKWKSPPSGDSKINLGDSNGDQLIIELNSDLSAKDDSQEKKPTSADSKINRADSNGDKSTSDSNSDVANREQPLINVENVAGTVGFDSLPTTPIQFFNFGLHKPVDSELDGFLIPETTPIWKSFSIEGSVGISTFKYRPSKKTVEPSFGALLSDASSNQISYDLRFGINYHFTNRLSFQTGIHYNTSKEDYVFDQLETTTYTYMDTVSFAVDTSTMDTTYVINNIFYDSTKLETNQIQNTYRIITIPFQFGWSQPISARGYLEFTAGGALSIYGRNTGYVIFSDNNEVLPAEEAYHTTGMLSVGGAVKYLHKFGDHHSVYVEPWAQFGVTNQFSQQLNYESRRYSYGIRFGYRFYL